MISAKLNGKDLILVEVPKGAKDIAIDQLNNGTTFWVLCGEMGRNGKIPGSHRLKDLKVLTTSDSITEEQAAKLVERDARASETVTRLRAQKVEYFYYDYEHERFRAHITALESFSSFLRSTGCKQGANYAVIEKL